MVDTSDYNYEHFAASQYSHGTFDGPNIGESAVDFTLSDTDGNEHSLSDYLGQFVVIETGSLTCPQYVSRIQPMSRIFGEHPDVAFLTIYVREAHPGSRIPQHANLQDKTLLASRLSTEEAEMRTLLVDELAGTVHQSYGAWPNMVYIVSPDGNVAFRGMWNNPDIVSEALRRLKANEPVNDLSRGLTANFDDAGRVLDRAGGYAKLDFVLGVAASAVKYSLSGASE